MPTKIEIRLERDLELIPFYLFGVYLEHLVEAHQSMFREVEKIVFDFNVSGKVKELRVGGDDSDLIVPANPLGLGFGVDAEGNPCETLLDFSDLRGEFLLEFFYYNNDNSYVISYGVDLDRAEKDLMSFMTTVSAKIAMMVYP